MEDSGDLTRVFEMLVNRLSDIEEKQRELVEEVKWLRKQKESRKTWHTLRWMNFFRALGLETDEVRGEETGADTLSTGADTLSNITFSVWSMGIRFTVVVYQGTDNTPKCLGKYASLLENQLCKPFIVVDQPIFGRDAKRRPWQKYLYHKSENKVPVIGLLVWEGADTPLGLPNGERPTEMTAAQIVEQDGKFCIIWSSTVNEDRDKGPMASAAGDWVHITHKVESRPHGFEALPSGRSWRDKVGQWRDAEAIWRQVNS